MNIQIQYRKKKLYFNKRKDTTVISLKTQLFWLETRSLSNLHSPNRILRNNLYIWFFLPNLMILVYSFPSQPTVTASFCVFNTLSTVTSRHVSLPHSPSSGACDHRFPPLSKPPTPQPFFFFFFSFFSSSRFLSSSHFRTLKIEIAEEYQWRWLRLRHELELHWPWQLPHLHRREEKSPSFKSRVWATLPLRRRRNESPANLRLRAAPATDPSTTKTESSNPQI